MGLALIAIAVGVGLRHRIDAQERPPPPSGGWVSDSITPPLSPPRNRASERVARDKTISLTVALACEMAAADGQVDEVEKEAIRAFIVERVTGADEAYAARMLTAGFAEHRATDVVTAAVETLRAIASDDQRLLCMELLAVVARADGIIHPAERAFLLRVGTRLGLDAAEVEALLG